jgi:hypothetical protein
MSMMTFEVIAEKKADGGRESVNQKSENAADGPNLYSELIFGTEK